MKQLNRLKLITSETDLEKISNSNILIIGLGGVGGYTFETLVRSGVEYITIVDGDVFEPTNLNRQLFSLKSTLGQYKTDMCEKYGKEINPNIKITKITKHLTLDNINEIDFNKFDYVVDACDTISIKKELIRICIKKNIKIITCMGTGNKFHPEMLEITDIRKTSYDPLAKIIRKMVRDEKIKAKIPVVSSKETPVKTNSNIIGSNAYVPATAGILMTSYVINDIIGVK